ncbi:hypothetical protein BD410DRAFT_792656 [Rickenella mellea]|uniref:Uncharacterized protein n=1 Tax=Rickenella mellea TaxID=50990 RepID=A0A4Y7PV01_9AGAM|nr:hypothetical protein BD410DRAFT_792656 [Rickenella mellea]
MDFCSFETQGRPQPATPYSTPPVIMTLSRAQAPSSLREVTRNTRPCGNCSHAQAKCNISFPYSDTLCERCSKKGFSKCPPYMARAKRRTATLPAVLDQRKYSHGHLDSPPTAGMSSPSEKLLRDSEVIMIPKLWSGGNANVATYDLNSHVGGCSDNCEHCSRNSDSQPFMPDSPVQNIFFSSTTATYYHWSSDEIYQPTTINENLDWGQCMCSSCR